MFVHTNLVDSGQQTRNSKRNKKELSANCTNIFHIFFFHLKAFQCACFYFRIFSCFFFFHFSIFFYSFATSPLCVFFILLFAVLCCPIIVICGPYMPSSDCSSRQLNSISNSIIFMLFLDLLFVHMSSGLRIASCNTLTKPTDFYPQTSNPTK